MVWIGVEIFAVPGLVILSGLGFEGRGLGLSATHRSSIPRPSSSSEREKGGSGLCLVLECPRMLIGEYPFEDTTAEEGYDVPMFSFRKLALLLPRALESAALLQG